MLPFVDRQKKSREANRPAERNVPMRGDWSTINTPDDRFGQYAQRVADQARYKYEAPQRAWDNMTNLHRVALAGGLDDAGEKQFKQARRDWNRQYKYTPVGMRASGVTNPLGAVNLYGDMSSHLDFDAPKLMDRMYPFSRGIGKLFNAAVENIGPLGWLNRIIPKRDPIVPENVKKMRDRFSPADTFRSGIADLVPDDIKNQEIDSLKEIADSGEGIFYRGRGDLPPDFDYEEDREGRERSEKIVFLESIHPNIDYDKVDPALIDELYEKALAKAAQEEEFMRGNIGALNPLQPD